MMADLILHPPQEHERRHEQDCAAVWTEHSAHFAEPRNIIVEMLDDIKGGHQIERGICEGQLSAAPCFTWPGHGCDKIQLRLKRQLLRRRRNSPSICRFAPVPHPTSRIRGRSLPESRHAKLFDKPDDTPAREPPVPPLDLFVP